MKTTTTTNKKKTLKPIIAVIIILFSVIGFLNTFIGTFINFIPQYLFGSLYPLVYIFIITFCVFYLRKVKIKKTRLFSIIAGAILLPIFFSVIAANGLNVVPTSQGLNTQLMDITKFIHSYDNLPHFFTAIDPGLVGYSIYYGLYISVGKVLTILISLIVIVVTLILMFYPTFKYFFKILVKNIKDIKRRNEVINKAKTVGKQEEEKPAVSQPVQVVNPPITSSENIQENNPPVIEQNIYSNEAAPAVFGGASPNLILNSGVVFHEPTTATFNPGIEQNHQQFVKPGFTDAEEIEEQIANANVIEEETILPPLVEEQEDELEAPIFTNPTVEQPRFGSANVIVNNDITKPIKEEEILQTNEVAVEQDVPAPINEKVIPPTVDIPKTHEQKTQPSTLSAEIIEEKVDEPVKEVVKPVEKKKDLYKNYVFPPNDLLVKEVSNEAYELNKITAEANFTELNQALNDLNTGAAAVSYTIGPSVTRFDIKMEATESVSSLKKYIPDLQIRLSGAQSRFEQVVRGKQTSGFEVANKKATMVNFFDCMEGLPDGLHNKMAVPFGKDVNGDVISALLDEFPHLLVAGSTGSGKSVYVHTILMALIMRNTPDELRLVIIDPKRVEMTKYNDLAHLLCPIIKEPTEAKVALNKLVDEMEDRYRKFEETASSKISAYNEYAKDEGLPIMPRIVVVIDEYADLYESEKDISIPVLRLAQKSRAAGIHILVATQRPSVQVITGQIKANLPTRVALMTASAIDSQTILGVGGAEELLGNGDMLVDCTQISRQGLTRIQGAYVRDKEIRAVTNFIKERYPTSFDPGFMDLSERSSSGSFIAGSPSSIVDESYHEVVAWTKTQDRVSISKIQQVFKAGFNRAKNLYESLLANGVIRVTDDANSSRGAEVVHENAISAEAQEIRDFNNN